MNGDSKNTDKKKKKDTSRESDPRQNGDQPTGNNPLKTFYEDASKVVDLPEYEKFRDKLTNDRSARKTLFEDIKQSGRMEGLPDEFSKFESKLFRIEDKPTDRAFQAGDEMPVAENVFSSIIGFGKEREQEAAERAEADKRMKKANQGRNVLYNIRRNHKIRNLEKEVEQAQSEYEQVRSQARENAKEVEGVGGTIRVPDPALQNKAQRLKDKRDKKSEQLSKVRQQIRNLQDTGQSATESAINTFVRGTLKPLSSQVLKSASNTIQLMKPFARSATGMSPLTSMMSNPKEKIDQAAEEDPTETELYKAGEQVSKKIEETFPENPKYRDSFWIKTLPHAGGFALATTAGGAGTRALGGTARLGGAIIGSAAQASSEFENALNRSGDPQKAFDAFLWNLPVGASEGMLPQRFFSKLNQGTGGAAAETLEKWVKTEGKKLAAKSTADKAKAIAGDFLKGGTEEFFQETAQNYLTNVGAANIYDSTRELFENVMEEGAAGFLIGSFLNGTASALSTARQNAEGAELDQIRKAEQFINEQQRKLVSGELPVTAEQASRSGQKLQPQIDFSFDPTAPPEQQLEKLKSERARLNDEASQMDTDDPAAADYDMAIAQIDDLIGQKQAELEGGEESETTESASETEQSESQQAPTEEPDEGTDQEPEQSGTRVYRETSIEAAEPFLPTSNTDTGSQGAAETFVTDNPDLAIGQGDNTGVLLEFDTDLEGESPSRRKPGLEFAEGEEYALNRSPEQMRDDLRRITVKPDAEVTERGKGVRFKRFADQLVNDQGWTRTEQDDGSIVYEHPSLSDEGTAQETEQLNLEQADFTEQEQSVLENKYVKKAEQPSPEDIKKALFDEAVGQSQRGKPESAMLKVQHANGGGVLNPVVEHLGDLTHRMSQGTTAEGRGYENVKSKVDRVLSFLKHDYGFQREMDENFRNNARAGERSEEEIREKVDQALAEYAETHAEIPVFNEMQELARDAAIDVGNKRFDEAIQKLEKLKQELDKGREHWEQRANEITNIPEGYENIAAQIQGDQQGQTAEQTTQEPTETTPYPNVSEDAQNFLEGVDATGVFPPSMTSRLSQLAEENGIEVDENTTPEDVIQRLRQEGAGLDTPPIGRPVAQSKLVQSENTPFRKGLAIAGRDRQTGRVYVGGATHSQLINEFDDQIDIGRTEMGFYTEDGQFLTREEATQWRNAQQEGAGTRESAGESELYYSESLDSEAAAPQPDEIQPGMLVQWNRQDSPQFDEPRRVREMERDAETGREYARVEGEPRWLPVSQLETVDPNPTQNEESLQAQIKYASGIGDLGAELASNNYDEATQAAEVATGFALDNGATSYEQFYSMTAEAIDGKPNPQALRNGWERALADPANSNKLQMNTGEGTLAGRFNEALANLQYKFFQRIHNKEHAATDFEKRISELYRQPDRFKRENVDQSISTFIKLMPQRLANIWDEYINVRKSYSAINKVVKEAFARDINLVDFREVSSLYEDLAKANKQGDTARAQEIEQEIESLMQQDELQQFLIAQHAIESNEFAQDKFSDEIEVLEDQVSTLEGKIPNLRGQKRQAAKEKLDELKSRLESRRHPLGMTTQEANQVLNDFRNQEGTGEATKYDDLMEVGKRVWEMDDAYLDEAVSIGVITPEDAERMRDTYQYHIPANRIITDEYGNVTGGIVPGVMDGGAKIFEREGSDRHIGSILTNIAHNFDKMFRYGLKNELRVKTANIIREELARGNNRFGVIKQDPAPSDFAVPFREVQERETPTEDGGTETEQIIQEKHLVFADKQMFDLYNEMNNSPVSSGVFAGAIRAIMNLQHLTIIGGTLTFGARNQPRDLSDAMHNALGELGFRDVFKMPKELAIGNGKGDVSNYKEFMKEHIVPYHQAIVRYEKSGKVESQAGRDYKRLKELGGITTFYQIRSRTQLQDGIMQNIAELQDLNQKKPTQNVVRKGLKKLGNGIDHWNAMWENSLRTVLFRTALDAGMGETRAAEFALETMPNFNQKGKTIEKLDKHFLFIGAAEAATASHALAWKKTFGKGGTPGVAKKLGSRMISGAAAWTMAAYFNAMMNDAADEENYERDKRMNTWKYHKNVVMNDYSEDGSIDQYRMPLGYGTSVYWGIGSDLYDLQQGYIDNEEFSRRLLTNLTDVYNPFSGADMFKSSDNFFYAMTPTWAKPAGSMATNQRFMGELYSEWKLANPQIEDWQLYSPYTPKPFRYASHWLNKNVDTKSNIESISPKTLELFWNWATNTTGKDIAGFKEFYDAFHPDEEFNADRLPILRGFYDDMSTAELNYNSLWDRVLNYSKDAPPAGSKEMEELAKTIESEYQSVADSDVVPDYQLESVQNGIQTYLDFLHDQRARQQAREYFDRQGWDGKANREKRYQYYHRENYKAKNFEDLNIRYEFKNGRIIKQTSARRAYSMDVIEDIEGKYKDPGAQITFEHKD